MGTVPIKGKKIMHSARGDRARVSVNFRKFSPRGGLTVYPPSRTLEPLALYEYRDFDTSALF